MQTLVNTETACAAMAPEGHDLVLAFDSADPATATFLALRAAGVMAGGIRRMCGEQMLVELDGERCVGGAASAAAPLPAWLQSRHALAQQGGHFLMVRVPVHVSPSRLVALAQRNGAVATQWQGGGSSGQWFAMAPQHLIHD